MPVLTPYGVYDEEPEDYVDDCGTAMLCTSFPVAVRVSCRRCGSFRDTRTSGLHGDWYQWCPDCGGHTVHTQTTHTMMKLKEDA